MHCRGAVEEGRIGGERERRGGGGARLEFPVESFAVAVESSVDFFVCAADPVPGGGEGGLELEERGGCAGGVCGCEQCREWAGVRTTYHFRLRRAQR